MYLKQFILLVIYLVCHCHSESYYWRHWNGTVPDDAFTVGQDDLGLTYVGKVYVPGYGLYVAGLSPNQKEVAVHVLTTSGATVATAPKNSNTIQVLCTRDSKNLIWMATNSTRTTLYLQEHQITPVLGGRTSFYSNNPIYVGKYISSGSINIGSVHSSFVMYYTRNSVTYSVSGYEVLIDLE